MRTAVGGIADILLDGHPDSPLVAAHVNGDLDTALASTTLDGLLDDSEKLVGPDGRKSIGAGFVFGGKVFLFLMHLSLPPNIYDHDPFEPKPKAHLYRLLSGTE